MRERTTDIKDIYNEQITPNYDVRQGSSEPQRRFRRSLAHVILWRYLPNASRNVVEVFLPH